ncbi:amino acid/polyamine/organocation transporter, APC superfamily [Arenibacter nanhaiticus]|uniref:Amino acid/polyamine/organocation transporter, APC superfamily n=1 Tax=Arenibacter nanhaiticus TaxID=558155 RepID=A0A1M6MHT0_9FLAO|nr:amino acid permease [Arenibacter nanhaiticus]SHJ83025.1 amino acid/polyamine/organocation transporter, APC superfamily [Arenibacter nanhaiticus]
MNDEQDVVRLKKQLGTVQILLYGVGTMLGAGIYVLVGKVAGYAGTLAPLSFLVAGILAGLTAYSYSLLSPRFPKSGGEIVYVDNAFNSKRLATLVGWGVIFTGFISAAAIIKGFVGYLDVFIEFPDAFVIIVSMTLLSIIAIWGIGESLNVIGLITLMEVGGLLFVILIADIDLLKLTSQFSQMFIKAPGYDVFAVFQGAFLAFYAFVGFEDLANVAEEAKNPKKSMPIAIMGSLFIALFLYIAIAVVAVVSLPLNQLAATNAPMAEILVAKGQHYAYIISLISLVAVLNGVLAQVIMGSRVLYGLAGQNSAPKLFYKVHKKYRTPVAATIVIGVGIAVLAIFVPIVQLANTTSYVIISVFVMVNLSQTKLAYTDFGKRTCWRNKKFLLPLIAALLCLVFLTYKILAEL